MKLIAALLSILILAGCSDANENETDEPVVADSVQYFQVKEFIDSEIEAVKTTPYFIYMISKNNHVQDSTPIDNNQFIQLAQTFRAIDLNNPKTKKKFRETVFEDQTTESYVLNYEATDASQPVQNIDVMLDSESQQVKRIDIRKLYTTHDTSYTEHLVWKTKESFQIIKIAAIDTMQRTSQIQVIWNSKN